MYRRERVAISRITWIIIIAVVLVVAVGEGYLTTRPTTSGGAIGIDLHIYEDNPVLQLDHFYPDTLYIAPNSTIQLAVQNGDDETRVFTLGQFDINVTIVSGTTERMTFQANKVGNFSFISPITPPSPVSAGRKGPCLEGFFIVTQNATLLSTTRTGSGQAPSEAAAEAAANGPIGSCTASPLTAPSAP